MNKNKETGEDRLTKLNIESNYLKLAFDKYMNDLLSNDHQDCVILLENETTRISTIVMRIKKRLTGGKNKNE